MAKLTGKLGEWDLPYVHMWKDRGKEIRHERTPIITPDTRIVTIGSCFAEELARSMNRLQLKGAMHPTGLFYNSASIRQEISRVFDQWPGYLQEPYWNVSNGYIHPFKSYYDVFPTLDTLQVRSDELDREANDLFQNADMIVITLGLIETWMQPRTGNFYRQIPPPEVFETIDTRFYRLTVRDMINDLSQIRAILKSNTKAEIVVTVSPVPLHSTFTPLDVRVANAESKSRIRAAVSEFVEQHPDVHYFHSYEIVTTSEQWSDFMLEDGRHVHPRAVDYIIQQFLKLYAAEYVPIPTVDTSWIKPPLKTSPRVGPPKKYLRDKVMARLNHIRNQVDKL